MRESRVRTGGNAPDGPDDPDLTVMLDGTYELDRLLDLVLVAVLRRWFTERQPAGPHWYRAHADPVVGRALRLMEEDPAQDWTVAVGAVARRVGYATPFAVSAAFTRVHGVSPQEHRTQRRAPESA